MNGLVGIQWREICVNFPIILSNMQAVGTDIVTERKTKKVSEYKVREGQRDQRLSCTANKLRRAVLCPKAWWYSYIPQILLHLIKRKHGNAKGENNVK